jgi:protein involved in polysaccharide export with SLBB domain
MTAQTKQVLDASAEHSVGVPRELGKQVLQIHYLEPGDELLIESNDIESQVRIPADQQVLADGTVDLGKYGRVKVAGLTIEQSEALIQSAIATSEERPAGINVRLIQSVQNFYVIGEVNSPGAYPLVGHETVLDGIVAAGGLTLRASACDLLLARPTDPCSCRVTLPVCYRAITQLGDTTTNYQLKPGDRIFVGRQSLWEELMQCCFCQKSCHRCCQQQRACCDPLVADTESPRFASPTLQTAPVEVSEPYALKADVHVDLGVGEYETRIGQSPLSTEQVGVAPPLDGELEFDELLTRP